MNIHKDNQAFTDAIQATSDALKILPVFIEKDYWITLVLKRLSESQFRETVVFKGGTSLSKGYKLISRFSEDIDIAVIGAESYMGNQLKKLIRDVEKTISVDLTEDESIEMSSKGSRFRKTLFNYPISGDVRLYRQISNRLIIEVNSFANPFPFESQKISSFILEFLLASRNNESVKKYGLEPFSLNVLDKRRTLIEKMASLIRFSFSENPIEEIAGKIRHFYDIYYLFRDPECNTYLKLSTSGSDLNNLINHDKEIFDEPTEWTKKRIQDSPIVTDFKGIWHRLKSQYRTELSALSYSKIPEEIEIEETFTQVLALLFGTTDSM